jgi:hypothetical protein
MDIDCFAMNFGFPAYIEHTSPHATAPISWAQLRRPENFSALFNRSGHVGSDKASKAMISGAGNAKQ